MSDIDIEAGVAILDIGGGTSDLAVFYEGILKHTAVIPFGGENITTDIKTGLGVLRSQAEALKVQFGSALVDAAQANAYITIPGFKGMQPREISMKSLAGIIQARMGEILDFVSFHLKQVGLDSRAMNGGIILTGGGSQLKHLIQLTEFTTGLNARIGIPNEHLAPNHIEELKKPMYSTCIGLILKGYNDHEPQYQQYLDYVRKSQAEASIAPTVTSAEENQMPEELKPVMQETPKPVRVKFWDRFKFKVIDMFSEEDQVLNK
jgi:cell division protein FtsA